MDKPLDTAPGLVPPRPARRRPRRAVPRAARRRARSGARSSSTATILDPLPRADRRVEFIRDSLVALDARAARARRGHGTPASRLIVAPRPRRATRSPRLAERLQVQAVYANHDDDPARCERDAQVRGALADARHRAAHLEGPRGLRAQRGADRRRHAVRRLHAVQERLAEEARRRSTCSAYPVERHAGSAGAAAARAASAAVPTLAAHRLRADQPARAAGPRRQQRRATRCSTTSWSASTATTQARDFPAVKGPSYLSVHLRFGTVSIRELARARSSASQARTAPARGAEVWLSELIWRDFYHQVLHHHPHVVEPQLQARVRPHPLGARQARPTRCSPPGARAAPATRWSTRRWRRSTRPATCTTACAW